MQARDLARDDLIRVLTGRSADAVHWLQSKFGLDLSKVARLGGHSQPRTHRGNAQFPGMVCPHPVPFPAPGAPLYIRLCSCSLILSNRRFC